MELSNSVDKKQTPKFYFFFSCFLHGSNIFKNISFNKSWKRLFRWNQSFTGQIFVLKSVQIQNLIVSKIVCPEQKNRKQKQTKKKRFIFCYFLPYLLFCYLNIGHTLKFLPGISQNRKKAQICKFYSQQNEWQMARCHFQLQEKIWSLNSHNWKNFHQNLNHIPAQKPPKIDSLVDNFDPIRVEIIMIFNVDMFPPFFPPFEKSPQNGSLIIRFKIFRSSH